MKNLQLKSLEIHGFKSFPDKTVLTFPKGFTAVVGPNGSGKSNISDAMRWVLGEQSSKTLRGTKMEDVIFLGTASRKIQGVAFVSLTFDNTDRLLPIDADEVIVSRKYYRSGESEYRMNGTQVLLKQIHELFMDTGFGTDGYAMIGQGRIDEIVAAKSLERRKIFEETAGITKFRHKKQEAQKKLIQAEENLVRLRDIMQEVEERLVPLQRQSEKAKKYQKLAAEKENLELSIWVHKLRQYRHTLRDQETKKLEIEQKYKMLAQEENEYFNEMQSDEQKIQNLQISFEKLQEDKKTFSENVMRYDAEKVILENDIKHLKDEIQQILLDIKETQNAQNTSSQEALSYENKIKEIQEKIRMVSDELSKAETSVLETEQEGEHLSNAMRQIQKELNQTLVGVSKYEINITGIQRQIQELEESHTAQNAYAVSSESESLAIKKELDENQSFLQKIQDKIESFGNAQAGYQLKLDHQIGVEEDIKQKLQQTENEKNSFQQKQKILQDLEQQMEGFSYSVKQILKQQKKGNLRGIYGTVASLIHVPKKYLIAIETALGGTLQHLVTKDDNAAKEAIQYLKYERIGRATFLPLSSIKGKEVDVKKLTQESGFLGVASSLISYDPVFTDIFLFLLGKTVVAEDLDAALKIANRYRYQFRIVTLDGQLLHAGGSLTGGAKSKYIGLLGRREEIYELHEKIEKAAQEKKHYQQELETYKRNIADIQEKISGITKETQAAKEDQIRVQSECKRLEDMYRQQQVILCQRQESLKKMAHKKDDLQTLLKNQQKELEDTKKQNQSLLQKLQEMNFSNAEYISHKKNLLDQTDALRLKLAEQKKDLEAQRFLLNNLYTRKEDHEEQKKKLNEMKLEKEEKIQKIKADIQSADEKQTKTHENLCQTEAKMKQILEERREAEKQIIQKRQTERGIFAKKEKLSQENARLQERLNVLQENIYHISDALWQEYSVSVSKAEDLTQELADINKANLRLQKLKNDIKSLGTINVAAIEEYQEVDKRHNFLEGQMKDIENAKKELYHIIQKLTKEMESMFLDTFQKVNREFQNIFKELFEGGKGSLVLEDPEHALDSGIEIMVQPPGKIVRNLSALSGGEKAFVAIAVYFAILKVKPSPFCVLDEIEAALDDVNVDKFASYVKQLKKRTQFIVITHRRGTMEQADMLYGVTMQEDGVSKLLSLNVAELEKDKAIY